MFIQKFNIIFFKKYIFIFIKNKYYKYELESLQALILNPNSNFKHIKCNPGTFT
jgi:hypothetical protein